MTDENPNEIAFQCTCGETLVVPSDSEGKQAQCPHCNAIVTVPTTTDEPIADASPIPEQLEKGTPQATCPMCNAAIDAADVTCATCGFQLRSATAAAAGRAAKSAGALMLGCVFSGLGALIGAAVWSGVAITTDYEIGWVAWGLGGLAGLGMHLGYRRGGRVAGMLAVACALCGIVIAKGILFGYFLHGAISGDTDRYDLQQTHVTIQITNEILVERGALSDADREREWPSASEEAERRVSAMSKAQVVEKWKAYRLAETPPEESAAPDEGTSGDDAIEKEYEQGRLAYHRASRLVTGQGLSPADEQCDVLYEQQLEAVQAMSDDEFRAAITELDAWEEGGKWNDPEYVRIKLIYARATDASYANDPNAPSWDARYQTAASRVDAMEPAEQLTRAKAYEAEQRQKLAEAVALFQEETAQRDRHAWVEMLRLFFVGMFSGMDVLFVLLAVMTSYQIGNGQAQTKKG